MVVLSSSFLKGFSESCLTAPILSCTADERDQSDKDLMKMLTKWLRKHIFWMNDISILIFELEGSPCVILLEGFSWVIPHHTHLANSGSESAKELPLLKMPPNEQFSSDDVDFSLVAALCHPLSKVIDNRAVSTIGIKLLYCLHRSPSSAYTVYTSPPTAHLLPTLSSYTHSLSNAEKNPSWIRCCPRKKMTWHLFS